MSTIMESKIKVLVQSVAQSAGAVVSSNPAIGKSQAGAALTKVGLINVLADVWSRYLYYSTCMYNSVSRT